MRITHLFSTFRNMGGVESILRLHWKHDASYGIDSHFISYLEHSEPALERVEFLGLSGKTNSRQLRLAFAAAVAKQRPEVCVYHGTWLVKYLADIDVAERRILQLHGSPGSYGNLTREVEPWADGLLCISRPQYDDLLCLLPSFSPQRTQLLHSPIFPPQSIPEHPPIRNRPFVIGYCGRLADDAKRVDRAPAFIDALDKAKLDYRMEFLGEGPLESQLKEQFRCNSRIVFHGRKSGPAYWEAIQAWDFFILFSDSEGMPISILETMNRGVLPIMPTINSGADYYARKLGAEFVYPPYNFSTVCDSIRQILQRPETEIQSLRSLAAEIVKEHQVENYFKEFANFLERIRSMPRRSSQIPSLPPWPLRSFSFEHLASLRTMQRRLMAIFRRPTRAIT